MRVQRRATAKQRGEQQLLPRVTDHRSNISLTFTGDSHDNNNSNNINNINNISQRVDPGTDQSSVDDDDSTALKQYTSTAVTADNQLNVSAANFVPAADPSERPVQLGIQW